MLKLAKLCLVITLFGQLFYNAATYYVGISHPSFPAWGILYANAVALTFLHGIPRVTSSLDLWFLGCLASVTLSFGVAGQSDATEFISLMLMWVVAPYLSGRLLGGHLAASDFRLVYGLAGVMLALMGFEYLKNPSLFTNVDRLHVFLSDTTADLLGGIHFYIASLFGGSFIIALATLSLPRSEILRARLGPVMLHLGVGLISLIVLALWGSRGGFLAALTICAALLLRSLRVSATRAITALIGISVVVLMIYSSLSEERRALVEQIPAALASLGQSGACITDGDSVLAHLTMLSEAWRLFQQAPLFGIGASNYGLLWCGQPIEFASPHSLVVHIVLEQGLIGSIAWFGLFASIFQMYLQNRKYLTGNVRVTARYLFFLWAFFFLVFQTSGNVFRDYQFFMITGLVAAFMRKHTQRLRERSGENLASEGLQTRPGIAPAE